MPPAGARVPAEGSAGPAVAARYDYVFIDCPPSLGLLTVNALAAADTVLIPLQCEYFALEGISELMNTHARGCSARSTRALEIEGVLLTMVDERTNLTQQVMAEIREHFKDKVFRHPDPAERAPGGGPELRQADHALRHHARRGAEAYLDLAKEVMAHEKKGAGQGALRAPAAILTAPSATRPRGRRAAAAEVHSGPLEPNPLPAALGDRPRAPRRARGLHPRERDRAADPRAPRAASATRSSRASGAGGPPSRPGLATVPVTVREVADDRLLELALVENIQRQELSPLEEAQAFQRLQEELRLTQEEVARKVGRDRTTVANTLRLLRLPREVRELLAAGRPRRRPRARAPRPRAGRGPDRRSPARPRARAAPCARWSGASPSCARRARARPPRAEPTPRAAEERLRARPRHARRDRAARQGRASSASPSRARPSCSRLYELLLRPRPAAAGLSARVVRSRRARGAAGGRT